MVNCEKIANLTRKDRSDGSNLHGFMGTCPCFWEEGLVGKG